MNFFSFLDHCELVRSAYYLFLETPFLYFLLSFEKKCFFFEARSGWFSHHCQYTYKHISITQSRLKSLYSVYVIESCHKTTLGRPFYLIYVLSTIMKLSLEKIPSEFSYKSNLFNVVCVFVTYILIIFS